MYKAVAAAMTIALAGCASTKVRVNDKNEPVIVDWYGRGLGLSATPDWLVAAIQHDFRPLNIASDRIVKVTVSTGKSVDQAKALVSAQTSTDLANELSQYVNSKLATDMSLGEERRRAMETAAIKTKVQLSGVRTERDFWQKKRNDNTEEVEYYRVYSLSQQEWKELVDKYRNDIKKELDADGQQRIDALFDELSADEDYARGRRR